MKQAIKATVLMTLLGAACASHAAGAHAEPKVGVQLWSVKDEIKQDFEGTLIKIAQLGIQGVEFAGVLGPYENNPAGLKAFLAKNRLECAGAHTRFSALEGAQFDKLVAYYEAVGCKNLVISMDKRGATPGEAAEMSKELSAMQAKLAAKGMRIGYHNHEQEMIGDVGSTPWDVIAKNTPKGVIMQQDVGWTTYAGKDPIHYVNAYPGRTYTTHFKAKFVKGATGGTPIIGQDKTDWIGLTKAVEQVGGTDWIIIEQEEYPKGMGQLEAVTASYKGLKSVLDTVNAK
ncbi:sugar phosphate isomerase/epimerase [Telluria mixta]|uniref:Sugar phosphate isomerase/epimerase n=1 Tax=Telluria mixta TaxID=34071 RepID=A0ABT2BS18_9BURK|nr:sugar phosphate isomerase/epimerase [Telluria mixta]MCS0627909.1 sugar phosphate isomerase/epimerase [Telluria mixta]WEM93972.1 sugar phosphate isomerase/epimerase [Telluria mixta]